MNQCRSTGAVKSTRRAQKDFCWGRIFREMYISIAQTVIYFYPCFCYTSLSEKVKDKLRFVLVQVLPLVYEK